MILLLLVVFTKNTPLHDSCPGLAIVQSAVVLALVAMNPAVHDTLTKKQLLKEMVKNNDSIERKCLDCYEKYMEFERSYKRATDGLDSDNEEYWLRYDKLHREYKVKKEIFDANMEKSLAEVEPIELIKLKTTVVFTSVSLMGQW